MDCYDSRLGYDDHHDSGALAMEGSQNKLVFDGIKGLTLRTPLASQSELPDEENSLKVKLNQQNANQKQIPQTLLQRFC